MATYQSYYPSPSPARSLLSCAKHTTPPPFTSTANSKLLTPNWIYTFSAKERDSETGLSYFGSRYYSSNLSIWLSVDPMSDKYASLSPYVYCADNPVKLVDPNGEEWETPEDANYAQHLISIAQTRQKQYDPSSREYKLLQVGPRWHFLHKVCHTSH